MLLGMWAARHRVLEEPGELTLLRRAGWGLFGAAVIGKLPRALILTDIWQAPEAAIVPLGAVYAICGYAGGFAISLGTWLVSLLLADVLRRKEKRGPAEVPLRHVTRRWDPVAG